VDEADSDASLLDIVAGAPTEPPASFWLATVREVFEETGILLARGRNGESCMTVDADPRLSAMREALMSDRATLRDVLQQLAVQPDFDALAYAAHWITPLAEPRRYDTRFFYAAAPPGCTATADEREMSDAVWLTAAEALERFRAGRLPMVFPTVRTLEGVVSYENVADALAAARRSIVEPILPSLVRVDGGVAIVIDADEPDRMSR
jgi:8-oxo-dGTP pyrophosphatase MutT (NUDIX family)